MVAFLLENDMIVSYGEILIDSFVEDGKEKQYVGGAPFNVVYQASLMGSNILFVGNIGNDSYGKKIYSFFEKHEMRTDGLRIDNERKTTSSKVALKNGERSFKFYRDNTADSYFDDESLRFIKEGDIIHLGSLMLSKKEGRDFATKVINEARNQNKILSFDINFRSDIFKDKEEALKIFNEFYPKFDIVKFSIEELRLFTNKDKIEDALSSLISGPKLFLITLGKEGSLAFYNNKIIKAQSIKTNVIDSTGAGDSFFGTFLSQIDSLGLRETMFLSSLMSSTLRFSNIAGALTCKKYGALSSMPTYKEVNITLENQH